MSVRSPACPSIRKSIQLQSSSGNSHSKDFYEPYNDFDAVEDPNFVGFWTPKGLEEEVKLELKFKTDDEKQCPSGHAKGKGNSESAEMINRLRSERNADIHRIQHSVQSSLGITSITQIADDHDYNRGTGETQENSEIGAVGVIADVDDNRVSEDEADVKDGNRNEVEAGMSGAVSCNVDTGHHHPLPSSINFPNSAQDINNNKQKRESGSKLSSELVRVSDKRPKSALGSTDRSIHNQSTRAVRRSSTANNGSANYNGYIDNFGSLKAQLQCKTSPPPPGTRTVGLDMRDISHSRSEKYLQSESSLKSDSEKLSPTNIFKKSAFENNNKITKENVDRGSLIPPPSAHSIISELQRHRPKSAHVHTAHALLYDLQKINQNKSQNSRVNT